MTTASSTASDGEGTIDPHSRQSRLQWGPDRYLQRVANLLEPLAAGCRRRDDRGAFECSPLQSLLDFECGQLCSVPVGQIHTGEGDDARRDSEQVEDGEVLF